MPVISGRSRIHTFLSSRRRRHLSVFHRSKASGRILQPRSSIISAHAPITLVRGLGPKLAAADCCSPANETDGPGTLEERLSPSTEPSLSIVFDEKILHTAHALILWFLTPHDWNAEKRIKRSQCGSDRALEAALYY